MTDSPLEYNFDDLFVGQKVNFLKKIDEALVKDFAKLSGDFNPLHMNEEYASTTSFGRRVCHGMLLASFFSQLVGMKLPGKNALYFSQTLNFRSPCYIDDTIEIVGKVTEKSDSTQIITVSTSIFNESKTCLIDGIAKIIVRQ